MAEDIVAEKTLLFEKLLTPDAQQVLISRFANAQQYLSFDVAYLTLLQQLLGLVLSANTNQGMSGFDIFNLNWAFELPTIDELLQGIYLKPIQIDINQLFIDWASTYLNISLPENFKLDRWGVFTFFFVRDRYAVLFDLVVRNGKYGESHYDSALYYNPAMVSALPYWGDIVYSGMLSGTLAQMSWNPMVVVQWARVFKNEAFANALALKIDLLEQTLEKAFFLDFNILDYSRFPDEGTVDGVPCAVIHTRQGYDLRVPVIDLILFGWIMDVSCFDIDRFSELDKSSISQTFSDFTYYRFEQQLTSWMPPTDSLLFSRSYEEMTDITKSKIVHTYATHRYMIARIRRIVKSTLQGYNLDAYTLNEYVMAVLDLVYRKRIGHQRLKGWKAQLSDDDFHDMWKQKWEKAGLNTTILDLLWERFKDMQKVVVSL